MLDMFDESSSPDALHVALGEGIADCVDAIESKRAAAVVINAAERIVVEAANGTYSKSGGRIRACIHFRIWDMFWVHAESAHFSDEIW
eukprot:7321678-Prymnesium_polylepis.1